MGSRQRIRFGPFELDRAESRLDREGTRVPLRPKAFGVLEYLASRPGRLVRKEELLEALWPETSVSDTVLKVAIRELRAALDDDAAEPRYIETAHRLGYRFIATVRSRQEPGLLSPLTSFIGRTRELAETLRLLQASRLLTLTGAGGCGKSRLALEAARGYEARDGAFWVDLASVSDPGSIAQAVASAMGLREEPGAGLAQILERHLASRELLLALDNCEHLVEEAAILLLRLLRSAPHLKVLATSREALSVEGEVQFPVPPMETEEGVRLFAERARSLRPDFSLSGDEEAAAAAICRRLDGMPLAIELAASRVKAFAPSEILARLDDRLRFLSRGSRGAPPRHRTLRAAIDWSYALLSEGERKLLARLSVFAGAFELGSAEAICRDGAPGEEPVAELLSRLIEKSLALREAGGCYRLLETVRQYAREKLDSSGELPALELRFLDHFLALATKAEPDLFGPARRATLERLENERGNLSSALGLAIGRGEWETALELSSALFWFWFHSGSWSEGRTWIRRALGGPAREPTRARAAALFASGMLAWTGGEGLEARRDLAESIAIHRALGDERGLAYALEFHGVALLGEGDIARARSEVDEAVALFRKLGADGFGLATVLATRGIVALTAEDSRQARAYLEESVAVARQIGDDWALALPLRNLGILAFREGRLPEAREALRESLSVQLRWRERWFLSRSLESLASVLAHEGAHEDAARLFGLGEALREEIGASVLPSYRTDYDRGLAVLRERVPAERLRALWAEGRKLSPEQALELAGRER